MSNPKDSSFPQKQQENPQGNPSGENEAPKAPVAQVVETSTGSAAPVRGGGEGGSPGENNSTSRGGRKKKSDRRKEDLEETSSRRNARISLFHDYTLNNLYTPAVQHAPGPAKMPKRTAVLHDAPNGEPTCPECGRTYASWKAVFGHLRTHKEKRHVCCFNPPKFTTEVGFPQRGQVGPSFIDLARQNLMRLGGTPGQEGAAGSSSVRGIDFDLNEPPEGTGDCAGFDLNILPLPEND